MSDKKVPPNLEKLLHDCVIEAGWPAEIMAVLRVEVTDDGYGVSYPNEVKEQVHDLEYGYLSVPPRPAIRKFMERAAEPALTSTGDDILDETLFKSGLL